MATINCPDCGKTVSTSATTCPHCGRPMTGEETTGLYDKKGWDEKRKSRDQQLGCLITLGIVVIIALVLLFSGGGGDKREDTGPPETPYLTLNTKQRAMVEELISTGELRFECDMGRVYVDPLLWAMFEYPNKENFALLSSMYCVEQTGSKYYRIDLYDRYSGKKIAHYALGIGLKVE